MVGECKAQGEGGDGIKDGVGPGEDLRALGGPLGHVGGEGKVQGVGCEGLYVYECDFENPI